jgi:hypothetical protein
MARLFERRRKDGAIVVKLPEGAVALLKQVVGEVSQVVAAPPNGELRDRLYPRAYLDPTEESAEQQWQGLVHDDLVQARVAAIGSVLADLEGAAGAGGDDVEIVLDDEAQTRWLTVLNDARLTLGTLLGVSEDEPLSFAADDPRATTAAVYELLGEIQADLVDVMLSALPKDGRED